MTATDDTADGDPYDQADQADEAAYAAAQALLDSPLISG